jgi:hypothetical protein
MTATISITEAQLYTALGNFLVGVLPCPVIQAQQNRIAMPIGNFVTMTSLGTTGLSTDKATYQPAESTQTHERSTRWDAQLDFYGPTAADYANLVATLMKTDYACSQIEASGLSMDPLYAEEPRQIPFVNAENQYEKRWSVQCAFQFNPTVVVTQQFAASLEVIPESIDVVFPPT